MYFINGKLISLSLDTTSGNNIQMLIRLNI